MRLVALSADPPKHLNLAWFTGSTAQHVVEPGNEATPNQHFRGTVFSLQHGLCLHFAACF